MMTSLMIAFVTAALTAWLVKKAAIIDVPNERSSHAEPTPRGGGLGVLTGFAAALAWQASPVPAEAAALTGVLICAALAALLGLADDRAALGEKPKFWILVILSLALAAMAGPVTDLGYQIPWLVGLAGSALWVFTTANTVNFMDGSDGVMIAVLLPASLVLGLMGEGGAGAAGFALAAALAGFAIWNAPLARARGSLFAGDAGSLGASFVFAGLALYWARTGEPGSVWLAPVLIMPFLADVLLTMAARFRAGRRLFVAHRAHAYQLLLRMNYSHGQVAAIWGGLTLGFGALALIGHAGPLWLKASIFLIAVTIAMILHRIVRNRARAAGLDVTQ